MKYLFLIIIALNSIGFSQDENTLGWNYSEIFMITRGLTEGDTVRYKLESIGSVWTKPKNIPPLNYSITDTLAYAYYPPLSKTETSNTLPENGLFDIGGFNFIYTNNQVDPYAMDTYGYGLYRITNNHNNQYFYLDYRDTEFCTYSTITTHAQDIWIRFNANTGLFNYRNNAFSFDSIDAEWSEIKNSEYLPIWILKEQTFSNSPKTSDFPNYWSNCLVGIEQYDDEDILNSSVVFGPHPTLSNPTEYRVYRAINVSDSSNEINYAQIGTTADSVFYFCDTTTDLEYDENSIYYMVKAKNSSELSDRTNILSVKGRINWNNTLALSTNSTHPQIVWGKYPDDSFGVTHYEIYRGQSGDDTPPSNYTLRATVSSPAFSYVDEELSIDWYFYKIRAKNNNTSTYSSFSNLVRTDAHISEKKSNDSNNEIKYSLSDNYPNPFNPSTEIKYSIKERGLVTIKVYDILGNVVKTLIKENKESGNYSVTFNAGNLSSGIYFYTIKVNDFYTIKKMLILK